MNLSGAHFLNPEARHRVIAAVIDTGTGLVVNAISSNHFQSSGVNELPANDNPVVATEYFDLLGNRIGSSVPGVRIERRTHADGSHTVIKSLRR